MVTKVSVLNESSSKVVQKSLWTLPFLTILGSLALKFDVIQSTTTRFVYYTEIMDWQLERLGPISRNSTGSCQ